MASNGIVKVRDGLVAVLKKLKVANGFQYDLPDDHIHLRYSSLIVGRQEDNLYPKCFVMIEGGRYANQPSSQQDRQATFTIILVTKKCPNTGNVDAQVMVEAFIEDMATLLINNDDLNATVQDAQLKEFFTDGGVADPEGVAAFSIEAQWYANSPGI